MSGHFTFGGDAAEVFDLYLLGGLEPSEAEEVRAHLARACGSCRTELAAARGRMAGLALLAPEAEPRPELKARILRAVAPSPVKATSSYGWNWVWGPLAVALALLCLVVYGRVRGLQERSRNLQAQVSQAQQQMQAALDQNRRLQFAAELMAAPATQTLAVKAGPAAPQGRAYLNPERGAVLVASNLAPVAPGHTYEMWLLPAKGNPIPAGVFQSNAAGAVMHSAAQTWSPQSATAIVGVAVSLEPSGGSPQPTGAIVLAAKAP